MVNSTDLIRDAMDTECLPRCLAILVWQQRRGMDTRVTTVEFWVKRQLQLFNTSPKVTPPLKTHQEGDQE